MNRIEKIALPSVFFLLCATAWMHILVAFSGDKVWLLLAARMWINGRKLYVDIVEVNPPLIIWLYSIPSWISLQLGFLKDYNVLGILGLALAALSAWLGYRLVKQHPLFADDARAQRNFGLYLLMIFVFFTRSIYFFDRDHIFFVLTFPYMLRFMPSLASTACSLRMRVGIGILAALGFCIKPHTVIVFAGIQLFLIVKERRISILWSVENAIIGVSTLLYFSCVWIFAPDYIRTVIPMAIATYSSFSRKSLGIFYFIIAFLTAGLTFADFRFRYTSPYRRDLYYFMWVSVCLLGYALANNGWGYTYHPLISQLLFLAGWVWCEYGWLKRNFESRGENARLFIFGQRASVIAILSNTAFHVYNLATFALTPECDWTENCGKTMPYVHYLKEHDIHSFGALSEDFHRWSELTRLSGASFDTRYNALWMVPKLVEEGPEFTLKHQWIVDNVARGLADDFDVKRPEVVFVDSSKEFFGLPKSVDLIAFFSGVPEFKAAWSHYRYVDRINLCRSHGQGSESLYSGCRYDIYRRVP